MFTFISIIFYLLNGLLILIPTKRSLQILLYILKVSNLIDYKSSFKSRKQFKTNIIHQNFVIDFLILNTTKRSLQILLYNIYIKSKQFN